MSIKIFTMLSDKSSVATLSPLHDNFRNASKEVRATRPANDQEFEIEKELTETKNSTVFIATSSSKSGENARVVLKAAHTKSTKERLETEFGVLQDISHPNVIKPISFQKESFVTGKQGAYMTLPYSEHGDLFDFVSRSEGVEEPMAQMFFGQASSAIEYIHSKNISHGDIKLENILINSNLALEFIDFGFAERAETTSVGHILVERKGTEGYMSPELMAPNDFMKRNGTDQICLKKCDVFALGVSLFTAVLACPPFCNATKRDGLYKHLYNSKAETFWKRHPSKERVGKLSQDFKNLMEVMLHP